MAQIVKKITVMLIMVSALLLSWGSWYQVEGREGSADVGIEFNDNSATKPPAPQLPYDDTPKGGVEPNVTKGPLLPQTGEMMTHLGILISGMVVIIVIFVVILDKQIQLTEE